MAAAEQTIDILKLSLFGILPAPKLRQIENLATVRQAEPGDFIIHEGVRSDTMFVILSGEVEILGKGQDSGELHRIRTLGQGETLGELNLVEHAPASASVRVTQASRLLSIPIVTLRHLMQHDPAFSLLYRSLSLQLNQRLKYTTEVTVKTLETDLEYERIRVSMGTLLLTLIIILSVYMYLLKLISAVSRLAGTTLAGTLPLAGICLIAAFINMKIYKFPLSFYGLTTHNWRPAVTEGILFSLPFLPLSLLGKWLLITFVDAYHNTDLFYIQTLLQSEGLLHFFVSMIFYIGFSVAVQEFIARGGIQSCLQHFLVGRYRVPMAILASSLLFSIMHLFISAQFAFATFFLGWLWGWLYYRHGTLVGACVSHAIFGVWCIQIMGIGMLGVY